VKPTSRSRLGLGRWASRSHLGLELLRLVLIPVTYSQALASASRDDVSTCGSPRGHGWCQDSVLCARYSFVVWIVAVACWYARANLSVVRSLGLPELEYGGNCLERTSGRAWTIFKIVNILCEMIYCCLYYPELERLNSFVTLDDFASDYVSCWLSALSRDNTVCVCFFCFVCVVLLYILCFLCINCVYNYKKNPDICLSLFWRSQTVTMIELF